ncbi:hypothetical protein Hanom_Chr06g00510291 [Helianthus anomalus]
MFVHGRLFCLVYVQSLETKIFKTLFWIIMFMLIISNLCLCFSTIMFIIIISSA